MPSAVKTATASTGTAVSTPLRVHIERLSPPHSPQSVQSVQTVGGTRRFVPRWQSPNSGSVPSEASKAESVTDTSLRRHIIASGVCRDGGGDGDALEMMPFQ